MAMTVSPAGPELREQLAGWTARGLIDAEQAASIGAAEAARAAAAAATPAAGETGAAARRLPLVVEALGYLGAVLAVIAGLTAARQLLRPSRPALSWPSPAWGQPRCCWPASCCRAGINRRWRGSAASCGWRRLPAWLPLPVWSPVPASGIWARRPGPWWPRR
jgi:hypothetical protein